jgi:sugar/nucleoside kinase (ribokinase family)
MKIITIGGATQDIFIHYENPEMVQLPTTIGTRSFLLLEKGKKIEIEQPQYYTGGGATNSAVSFKRLGYEVTACFKIGADTQGDFILEKLKNDGISVDCAIRSADLPTAVSFIIPCSGGDRTVLVSRGATQTLSLQELPLEKLTCCQQVYITSLSGLASHLLVPIVKTAKKNNIPVAVNPGSSQLIAGATNLRDALPFIDILILNSFEANLFMASLIKTDEKLQTKLATPNTHNEKSTPELLRGPITHKDVCFNITTFFKTVLSRGPKIVAVTNGAEGVYVASDNHLIFHPSIPVKVVSTIGAGDSFGSCFVAQLNKGKSLEDSLRCGILNSTSIIQYLDAKTGLLSTDQLEKQLQQLDKNLLQHFPLTSS